MQECFLLISNEYALKFDDETDLLIFFSSAEVTLFQSFSMSKCLLLV